MTRLMNSMPRRAVKGLGLRLVKGAKLLALGGAVVTIATAVLIAADGILLDESRNDERDSEAD